MLTGEHILLRALEPDDLELLYRWENDAENWNVTNTYIPFSKHNLKNYIHSARDIFADRQFRFVIESIADRKPLGFIDLFEFEPFHLRAGVGVLIGEKGDRQKGYAREALQLLIAYTGKVLGLRSLFCNVLSDNKASIQLFSGAGFQISGKKEAWHRTDERWEDELFMQLQLPSL